MVSSRSRVRLADRFDVGAPIAPGGFGSVFSGEDVTTGETVAIKIYDPWVERDTNFVAFFRHRARQAMSLSHPNVVRTIDYGFEDETYFLVWEFVDGGNLEALLQRSQDLRPSPAVLQVLLDACRGLAFMHSRDVVHGRLNPAAVLVRKGKGVVGDIGPGHQLTTTGMTMTSVATASVTYLSPEQLSGHRATAASDIYAIGVMLYEACTGRLPFTATNPVALAVEHLETVPPSPLSLNPHLPTALDTLIMCCLAKAPEDRFSSVDELGETMAAAMLPQYDDESDEASDYPPFITPDLRRMMHSGRGPWQVEIAPGHIVHYYPARRGGRFRRLLRAITRRARSSAAMR